MVAHISTAIMQRIGFSTDQWMFHGVFSNRKYLHITLVNIVGDLDKYSMLYHGASYQSIVGRFIRLAWIPFSNCPDESETPLNLKGEQ